jgi:molybdopterin-biosynthesis enzyme MoeA-like protein
LGTTVDDPTRQAVAQALHVKLEFHPEFWAQIQTRFARYGRKATENNRRQAYIPQGAIAVENPIGTAPAFIVERGNKTIISLPGVPRELEYLWDQKVLPYLTERYHLKGTIKVRILHLAGIGESQVDEWISDLETQDNPTVGLLAHPGQIDIRIAAKADSEEHAHHLINLVETIIRERCGDHIYGADTTTLEQVVIKKLASHHWSITVVEYGLGGALTTRLTDASTTTPGIKIFSQQCENIEKYQQTIQSYQGFETEVVFGVCLQPGSDKQELSLKLLSPKRIEETSRSFGGPPANAILWSVNMALDYLRRNLSTLA